MTREEALETLAEQPYDEKTAMQDLEYIVERLYMNKKEFLKLMDGENKTFRDYKNSEKLLKSAIKIAILIGMEKRNFR